MTQPAETPGTPLKSSDFKDGSVLFVHGAPNARYAWDHGVAMRHYLQGFKEGKIIGAHFPKSGRTVVPPRAFDERSFSPNVEYVELEQRGTVNTFSICHVTWDVQIADPPLLPAVIEIDGADPGCGILHLLGDVDAGDVKIGMKVQPVWKPEAEREGAVTDIKYWKPAVYEV